MSASRREAPRRKCGSTKFSPRISAGPRRCRSSGLEKPQLSKGEESPSFWRIPTVHHAANATNTRAGPAVGPTPAWITGFRPRAVPCQRVAMHTRKIGNNRVQPPPAIANLHPLELPPFTPSRVYHEEPEENRFGGFSRHGAAPHRRLIARHAGDQNVGRAIHAMPVKASPPPQERTSFPPGSSAGMPPRPCGFHQPASAVFPAWEPSAEQENFREKSETGCAVGDCKVTPGS